MKLRIQRLDNAAIIPHRAHQDDAGLDLYTINSVMIPAGATRTISTGLAIALPAGTVGLIYPRSGLATKHGIKLANSVGVIDSGYRGPLMIALHNAGHAPYTVSEGTRVAQMIVTPYLTPEIVVVDNLDTTDRGTQGFGSTGVSK